jgi:alanine dehydrogenase
MLLLTNAAVKQVITMAECVDAIEEAVIEVSNGWAMSDPRIDRHIPTSKEEAARELNLTVAEYERQILQDRQAKHAYVEPESLHSPWTHVFKTMYGVMHKKGIGALRASSETLSWPVIDGVPRYAKIPTGPGGRYTSMILLFSTRTGQLLCIMPDGYIQRNRVAATGAVGTKYLSRPDAATVGMLGSGMLAGASIEATAVCRPLKLVKVFSPNSEHRTAFAQQWTEQLGIEIRAVDSPEEALRNVDIVIGATNAANVLHGRCLEPGMHLNTTSYDEVDNDCVKRADVTIISWNTDPKGWAVNNYVLPAGNSQAPIEGWPRDRLKPTLSDLLAGKVQGRERPEQITYHMNSAAGVQFAAVGALIYENARKQGVGRDLPDDWFLEEMHP